MGNDRVLEIGREVGRGKREKGGGGEKRVKRGSVSKPR